MTDVELLPGELLGVWSLDRVVHDRLTDQRHAVEGTTTFESASNGAILWSENGTMRSPFGSTPIQRRLHLVRAETGRWQVRFEDERPFHEWDTTASMIHQCDPDEYVARIEADRDSAGTVTRWAMTWDAIGPHKDYRIESTMVRADPHPR